jgi:hypothetical protein
VVMPRAGGRHEWAAARVASLFFFKFLTRTDEAPRNLNCVNLGITGWAPGDCGALRYAPPAVTMFSVSMTSIAFADNSVNGNGEGLEHSLNSNTCVNAGGGNGGEFGSFCLNVIPHGELDPGQSGLHNQAPEAGKCGELKC